MPRSRPRMLPGHGWRCAAVVASAVLALSGCGAKTPLEPVNRDPSAQPLVAFPSTIAPGDSAVVVCQATDADGDSLRYEWFSDCRLLKRGQHSFSYYLTTRANTIVVYPGTCGQAPLDTGWVSCDVYDGRGGGAFPAIVRIIIQR